jgi:hypothetical protein
MSSVQIDSCHLVLNVCSVRKYQYPGMPNP